MATPTIASVQTGSASFDNAGTTTTITSVDTSKSILFFSTTYASSVLLRSVSGELTDSTTITWEGDTTSDTTRTVEWTVLEFSTGVSVQRGSLDANIATSASITAVDLSKSFIVPGGLLYADNNSSRAECVAWHLSSTTTIEVETTNASDSDHGVGQFQVVEFDEGISVQRGSTLIDDATSATQSITTVADTANCVVTLAGSDPISDIGSRAGPREVQLTSTFNSTSEIEFERGSDVGGVTVYYEIIEFTGSGFDVQKVAASFGATDTQVDTTITAVDLSESFIWPSFHGLHGGGGGRFPDPADSFDDFGAAQARFELTSTTNARATRGVTASGGSGGGDVALFTDAYVVSIGGTSTHETITLRDQESTSFSDSDSDGDTQVTPTMPTHVSGDLLVAHTYYSRNQAGSGWVDDGGGGNGWTRAANISETGGRDQDFAVFYKVAASASETAPTFTVHATADSTTKQFVCMKSYAGVDPSTPMDATPVTERTQNQGPTPQSQPITTVTDGAVVISGVGVTHMVTMNWTAPTGYTLRGTFDESSHRAAAVADKTVATAGTETPGVFGADDNDSRSERASITLALRPKAISSTTEVTSTSTLNYSTLEEVSGTLSVGYEVVTAAEQTLSLVYESIQDVDAALDLNYQSVESVNSTVTVGYETLSSVTGTIQPVYHVLESVNSTVTVKYNAESATTSVSNQVAISYQALESVTDTIAVTYSTLNSVTNTLSSTYESLESVSSNIEIGYETTETVVNVSSELNIAYTILDSVSKALVFGYSVESEVLSSTALDYQVESLITQTLSTKYEIVTTLSSSVGINYSLENQVTGSVTVSYDAEAQVVNTTSLEYSLQGSVAQTLRLSYSVQGNGLPVYPTVFAVGSEPRLFTVQNGARSFTVTAETFNYVTPEDVRTFGALQDTRLFSVERN